MTERLTRRIFLGGLSALMSAGAALANAPVSSLRPQPRTARAAKLASGGIGSVVARAGLRGEVVCAVAHAGTGLELEALGGAKGLPPASVAKALTAIYALEVLGGAHRFETRLVATGGVRNGVVGGDLILLGGADPTLDTTGLAQMAANLKAAGIREVRGAFKVCDGVLPFVESIDPEQPDHVGYSPAVSGIALNFNRVHFEWKQSGQGYSVAMDARTEKFRPQVDIARMKVVKRALPVYTYADRQGRDLWTVASGALGKGGARWLPVRKPAAYAGDVFRTLARSHGIVLKQAEVTRVLPRGAAVLVTHRSAELQGIVRRMLKFSNNLTAETVGLAATVARGKTPRSLKESGLEMSSWAAARFGMSGTRLVDHSGLGDASRMTPQDLVGALVIARKTIDLRPLLKAFPMRDERGRIDTSHPIRVDAKTGTLNFVSGLGGFMTAQDGTELAFAIFTADTAKRSRIKRADRDRPEGARSWNRQSKKLQQALIERWGRIYGT